MARGYGQYCPLALAAELLAQRWTLLIVSRLLGGCRRFAAIQRAIPRISPSMLSQRLTELEDAGVVLRGRDPDGSGSVYTLTPAGVELGAVIEPMAVWGQRWSREMVHDDLDPAFLAWSMHSRLDVSAMPPGRVVIEFVFTGTHRHLRRFWLVKEDAGVEMCLEYPGFEVDLIVRSDLRRFVEIWRGFHEIRAEIRAGRIRLEGPAHLCRAFPAWLQLHVLAHCPRPSS